MKIEKTLLNKFCFQHLRSIKASNFTSSWIKYHARRETGNSGAVIKTGMLVFLFFYSSSFLLFLFIYFSDSSDLFIYLFCFICKITLLTLLTVRAKYITRQYHILPTIQCLLVTYTINNTRLLTIHYILL